VREDITIRELREADAPALLAYLERLPPSDRRLRFFGPRVLTDHVTFCLSLPERGGQALVAMQRLPDGGGERCVGEACLVPRPDGADEFALSVDVEVRGGTGTALFEELRRRAAARGHGSLHGDVMADNGPMLGLLRRRGGVTIDRESDHEVGIIVGTAPGAPPWPRTEDGRRRVLVEATGGRWSGERALRSAGFQVAVCSGPTSRAPGDPCPLLVGEPCALVDGADVIVHLLPSDEAAHRRVAAALPADGPAVFVTPAGEGRVPVSEVLDVLAEDVDGARRSVGQPLAHG
jgi:hypothetical protein